MSTTGQQARKARSQLRHAQFVPPATLDEAEARRAVLVEKTQSIDAQLSSDRAVADPKWRSSAVFARQIATEQVRQLNAWIKGQRRHNHALTVGAGGVHSDPNVAMLSRAYRLLKTWASEIDDVDPQEQEVIDAILAHLQRCVDPGVSP